MTAAALGTAIVSLVLSAAAWWNTFRTRQLVERLEAGRHGG